MPHYKWVGINLNGNFIKGKNFAISVDDLNVELLQKEIGLLRARKYNPKFNFVKRKSIRLFFGQLSKLVNSGIRIFNALGIIYPDTKDKNLKNIIKSLKDNLAQGLTFTNALKKHENIFDHVSIALIDSGNSSGKIGQALALIDHRLKTIDDFSKKLKSALMMPIITIIFFIVIALSIFIFVVPRFESIFEVFNQPLPQSTKIIFGISKFLRSINLFYILFAVVFLGLIFFKLKKRENFKSKYHKFLIICPLTKNFVIQLNNYFFLNCLALLLKSGIHLTNGLIIAKKAINNLFLQNEIDKIILNLENGRSLADSIKCSIFSSNEFYTMINVGQESGNFAESIFNTSQFYQDKIYQKLNFWISIIQPLLLIFIGLFIAFLIYSVYVPIFNMSNVIS
ncbi:type II secretion system F family protein [Candidatus Dependentiae bacterium]|nr:type II secretion system F family protein [Candidatus Dependentiae bacterium]